MSDGFERTRETAVEAASTARMLKRVAEGKGRIHAADVARLLALAARYTEYYEALLETVGTVEDLPDPDQAPLL